NSLFQRFDVDSDVRQLRHARKINASVRESENGGSNLRRSLVLKGLTGVSKIYSSTEFEKEIVGRFCRHRNANAVYHQAPCDRRVISRLPARATKRRQHQPTVANVLQ